MYIVRYIENTAAISFHSPYRKGEGVGIKASIIQADVKHLKRTRSIMGYKEGRFFPFLKRILGQLPELSSRIECLYFIF